MLWLPSCDTEAAMIYDFRTNMDADTKSHGIKYDKAVIWQMYNVDEIKSYF